MGSPTPIPSDLTDQQLSLAQALIKAVYSFITTTINKDVNDPILGVAGATGDFVNPIAKAQAAGIATGIGAVGAAIEPWMRTLATVLIQLMAPIATQVLKVIGEARTDAAGPINEVIVGSLSELLGVELSADNIPTGGDLAGNTARAQAIGAKLHEVLLAEFAPDGVVTPESAEKAARAFTGFNINFGVTTAFIAIVAEMFSLGQLKEFRELGVTVAENLGLGRLHRSTMKPLIDNTVAKPYDRLLRARYRPDALSEGQFVKALARGTIQVDEVKAQLAQKGLPDSYIDEVIAQLTAHLNETDLERLVRFGEMTQDAALQQLQAEGFPAAVAQQKIRSQELAKAETIIDSLIGKYRSLVEHRFMDTETFNTLVSALPISETQKTWEIRLAGAGLDFPHKRITLAQLFTMEEDGILDLTYFDTWAKGEGFSDEDALNLQLLLFKKEADLAAAAKAKAARAAAAAAKAAAAAAAKAAKNPPAPSLP